MKFFIKVFASYNGADVLEAENKAEANDIGWEMANRLASDYMDVIDFSIEEYNAEKHDMYL